MKKFNHLTVLLLLGSSALALALSPAPPMQEAIPQQGAGTEIHDQTLHNERPEDHREVAKRTLGPLARTILSTLEHLQQDAPHSDSSPPPSGGNGMCSGVSEKHLLGLDSLRCGGDCSSPGQTCKKKAYSNPLSGSYWVCVCGEDAAEPTCCHLRLWADFTFTVNGSCPPCGASGVCTLTADSQAACLNPPRPPAPRPEPTDSDQSGSQSGN